MERTEIEELFAKIDTQEASTLPDRWWDKSTFKEHGIIDIALIMVVLGTSREHAYRDIFRGMFEFPQGRRTRVLNPPKDALVPFVESWNRRVDKGALQIADEGRTIEWTDFNGEMRLAVPVLLVIYKAEPGTPGFW